MMSPKSVEIRLADAIAFLFALVILIYAVAMNWLDKKHHDELTRLRNGNGGKHPGQGPAGHDRASGGAE